MIFTVPVSSFAVHPSHFNLHIIGGKDAFILDIVYALKEFGVKLLFGKFTQSKGCFTGSFISNGIPRWITICRKNMPIAEKQTEKY